jgi:hypothetical protein
MELVQ